MKRSNAPRRKTPLKRSSKPIARRTQLPRGKVSTSGHKRVRKTNPEVRAERDLVRAEVFRRDNYACRLDGVAGAGPCFGHLTFHHRRKSGQGGKYTVENGAALCVFHNDELEANVELVAIAKAMSPPLVLDAYTARVEAFWSAVNRNGPVNTWRPELGPCWLWTRSVLKNGYASFHAVDHSTIYAHRFAKSLVEDLDPDLEVDHLCRVVLCVRPDHLEQVTPAENRRRQGEAKAAAAAARTRCANGHEMTEENTTTWTANRTRRCRTCERERSAANRQKQKEKT